MASPRGALVKDDRLLPFLLRGKTLVTVGDVTTKRCLELGLVPRTAIFDGKTRRSQWVELRAPNGVLKAFNPPGQICLDAAKVVKKAILTSTWVKVEGEEDLLAIPALLSSENGWALLYGQPKAGVVLVEINKYTKLHFLEIIKMFDGDVEEFLREFDYDPNQPLLGELDERLYDLLFPEL